MKIVFIGGGNMATALIGGLLAAGTDATSINVADPDTEVRKRLNDKWPVNCYNKAADAIKGMDMIVLAVKPQVLPQVLKDIGFVVSREQLLISIVAGIPVAQITAGLESLPAIVRTMPNTPALIGLGITALHASQNCSTEQRKMSESLMRTAGEVVWLENEDLMDVVTAVSGSGPAYFFYLIEAMQNAGTRLGLPADIATKLALHTAVGASTMAVQSDVDVAELRRRVTSKGGTTQAAVEHLQAGHFESLVNTAIEAAALRGRELAGGSTN